MFGLESDFHWKFNAESNCDNAEAVEQIQVN